MDEAGDRPLTTGMKIALWSAGVLVVGIGVPLLAAPGYTDVYFVWPVEPAATAGFLGANYVAAGVLEITAARQRRWADARATVAGVMAFTLAALVLTLIEARTLNFSRIVVWVWTAVYAGYPVALAWAWRGQVRLGAKAGGVQREGSEHLEGKKERGDPGETDRGFTVMRWTLAAIAAVLVGYAAAMVGVPRWAGRWWAWDLHPLGAYEGMVGMEAYIGVWLLGLGVVALSSAREPHAARLKPVWAGAMALGVLQAIVLLRSAGEMECGRVGLWVYVAALAAMGAVGAIGWRAAAKRRA
jgi:hypothetical protein